MNKYGADTALAADYAKYHQETAARLGISEDELWRRKQRLKVAWRDGGGFEGARARLKFAEEYLAKAAARAHGRTVKVEYKRIGKLAARIMADQEPLGPEFEAVWDANRETLYEP